MIKIDELSSDDIRKFKEYLNLKTEIGCNDSLQMVKRVSFDLPLEGMQDRSALFGTENSQKLNEKVILNVIKSVIHEAQ